MYMDIQTDPVDSISKTEILGFLGLTVTKDYNIWVFKAELNEAR